MDRIKSESLQFLTASETVRQILQFIPKIAETDITVLITGESGTGKEIIANLIHAKSSRHKNNFIAINCAALPADMLESELFGHKKGAFTGATHDHRGLFEVAEGGTIFLDEIGDMPLHLQAKLLRIIQQKKVRPLGACGERFVDFRIISATHKSLKSEIKKGHFREDLYYRLNGVAIHLPPLRERPEDIPILVSMFAEKFAEKYSLNPIYLSQEAMNQLMCLSWPGNVRQLEHLIEQLSILHQGQRRVEIENIPLFEEIETPCSESEDHLFYGDKYLTVSELTDRYIRHVYQRMKCHQGKAAQILGLSRRTLHRKLRDINALQIT